MLLLLFKSTCTHRLIATTPTPLDILTGDSHQLFSCLSKLDFEYLHLEGNTTLILMCPTKT